MSEQNEKLKALNLTIEKLEKSYGKGAVMKLSDESVMDVPSISTGSIGLDIALGQTSGGLYDKHQYIHTVNNYLLHPKSC